MKRWDDATFDAYLPAEAVLSQVDTAVIATDRASNLLYANVYAAKLFGLPADFHHQIGHSILHMGFEKADLVKAAELAKHVLRGLVWEGTFVNVRQDGSRVFVRAQAAPLRHPSGAIDGIVIFAREAMKRGNEREFDRIGLLEQIGDRLAGSLELDRTLRHVAETLVPQFADHCFIDLRQSDKLVRRVTMHAKGWQPAPGIWAAVGETIRYPQGHFCQQAMETLDTVVVEDYESHRGATQNDPSGVAGDEVSITSAIASPLIVRGELLGVMSLALSHLSNRDDLHYDSFDREFVGAVAGRVAIAIDNAMLFEEERRTALAFQTSLLPQEIPKVDGLEIACRYVPAKPLETRGQGIQTQVGGDWYDIIPLSAGRVAIVIGDVEGRGARAAAIMGQLRAALRAFAQDDKPPAEMLRKLDEWCRTLGHVETDALGVTAPVTPIVSCTYLVYDAWTRKLTFANAGHDAPLLIVDGEVGQLEIEHKGVLLGVRSQGVGGVPPFREEQRELPPGATLVLYTDGLTDRRSRADGGGHYTEDEAAELLRQSVKSVAHKDAEALAKAAEEAVPGDIDDDMAIVVVRSAGDKLPAQERVFPAEPIMVSEARRMAADTFAHWGLDHEQAELACLLVSEVVTNVVLHAAMSPSPRRALVFESAAVGSGPSAVGFDDSWELAPFDDAPISTGSEFTVRLRRGESAIWVEVFDSDLRLPRIRSAGENDEGGRGLYLVDQLASRWGSRPTKDGKAVWFEVPVRRAP
ncbi:MAG TPA: SpoIIE family protein phosphatase [Streptosporangiaceae bacterium]|nr:SpoIIE family protein phosphatase [Streptosporangiaceae bacterium]